MFVFLVFLKIVCSKSCSSFEDLFACKIPWSHMAGAIFCIHLRSLNVHHFGIVADAGLKSMALRSPSVE
jgi:hypothetical protein